MLGVQHPRKIFRGCAPPANFLLCNFISIMMINYVSFTWHVFFISFIVSLSRYFSLQITVLNSPNGIYASGKGSTKLACIHLTILAFGQCPVGRCHRMRCPTGMGICAVSHRAGALRNKAHTHRRSCCMHQQCFIPSVRSPHPSDVTPVPNSEILVWAGR